MSLLEHARRELALLGPNDEMQQAINAHLLKMVEMFSAEGHSGFSAAYTIGLLEKLLRYEPLTPLTGRDEEWVEIYTDSDGSPVYQNNRCSHVFKDKDGASDIEGRIFRDPNGSCWQTHESGVPVMFPYTPKREYVDRPAETT